MNLLMMDLFEWEIRTQAFQNTVFCTMCNRISQERNITFAGQSLAADPNGNCLLKAGNEEALLLVDLPLEDVKKIRRDRPWLLL